jgi:hypothetical protein
MKSKKYIWIFIGTTLALALFVSLFIGTYEVNDSFAYAVFGEYIYNHRIVPMRPFNLDKPQTLFPPVYALFSWPLTNISWPYGMTMLPFVQVALLMGAAYTLYVILVKYVKHLWATIGLVLYILLPFNLIYTTFIMSEILTAASITLYLFVLWSHTQHRPWATPSLLFFITVVATLNRYALLPLCIIHFTLYVISIKKGFRWHHLVGIIGIIILASWAQFNHSLYGKWGLSSVTGRHLYNNVVYEGKLLPPADSAAVKPFLKWNVHISSMLRPWWDAQMIFNDGILPERTIDDMFLYASIAAIQHQPVAWIFHVIKTALIVPVSMPNHPNTMQSDLAACSSQSTQNTCRIPWNAHTCKPALHSCAAQLTWSSWIGLNKSVYPYISALLFFLAVVGIIVIYLQNDAFLKMVAIIFLVMHMFQSATEWISGRFLIPLYPMYAILITLGLQKIVLLLKKEKDH